MAHAIYDRLWAEAIAELRDIVKVEDPTLGQPADFKLVIPEMKPDQAYAHGRIMYLKYSAVYKKLERVYRGLTHPQKREAVAKVIETVLKRLAQMHAVAVKYAPFNPEVAAAQKGKPFKPLPWPYVSWDDLLTETKTQPDELDLPAPAQHKEEREEALKKRDAAVMALCQQRLGVDMVALEARPINTLDTAVPGEAAGAPGALPSMSLEEALAVLVRNERGRQGKQKVAQMKRAHEDALKAVAAAEEAGETGNAFIPKRTFGARAIAARKLKEEEEAKAAAEGTDKRVVHDDDEEEEGEEEDAVDMEEVAVECQRVVRGFLARRRAAREMVFELEFLGAKSAVSKDAAMVAREQRLAAALARRRADQAAYRRGLVDSLPTLQSLVMEEEGPGMRERLKAERDAWLRNHLLTNNNQPPDEIGNYYEWKAAQAAAAVPAAAPVDPKAAEAAKKAAEAAPEADKPPALIGHTAWSTEVDALITSFNDLWLGRDESSNPEQKHEPELAKGLVRPAVQETLRAEVDQQVADEIENLKAAQVGKKKKPAKKKKPPKEKKKKEKPLPGAKLCVGMDVEAMLAQLVEFRMVNAPRPDATFDTFYGDHNMLLTKYNGADTPAQRHPVTNAWIPADPSNAQVRDALTNSAVLPLGSPAVRAALHEFYATNKFGKGRAPRSFLLYGPPGCGKSHLAQAIAHASGALFINVSAGVTEGKCMEKGGQAKLLHLAFEVAKSADYGPAVIYVDQVHMMFPGAGAKGPKGKAAKPDPNGPVRFKKDMMTYINSITPEHRVIVVASTSEPWSLDPKAAVDAFDSHLYIPPLDHGTRLRCWKREAAEAIADWERTRDEERRVAEAAAAEEAASAAAFAAESNGGVPPPAPPPPPAAPGPRPPKLPSLSSAMVHSLGRFEALPMSGAAAASVPVALPSHPWLDKLNFGALTAVTAGYSAGSIKTAVRMTLTHRRLDRWKAGAPVSESDFVSALACLPRMYGEEADQYRDFTDKVTGLDKMRVAEDPGAAAPKKKK